MRPQRLVTPDLLTLDKHLGRGVHAVLALEGIGFLSRAEHAIVQREALAPEQVPRFQPEGTDVLRRFHAV